MTDHKVKGSFYIAGGLAERDWENGLQFTPADVRNLLAVGHEVGCHTFSHPDVAALSTKALQAELGANRSYLAEIGNGHGATTFAYPYGSVPYRAKREMLRRFLACRGVRHGINAGHTDFGELKSVAIPSSTDVDASWIKPWLDDTIKHNGWLIFYTHDVSDTPTPYGCTPATLHAAIAAIKAAGVPIVTVAEGARRVLGYQGASETTATAD